MAKVAIVAVDTVVSETIEEATTEKLQKVTDDNYKRNNKVTNKKIIQFTLISLIK